MSRLVKSVVLVGLFALASNVWAAPEWKPAPVPVDVKLLSSRVVPVDEAVKAIEEARARGEVWADAPVTMALYVAQVWPDTSGERNFLRLAVDSDGGGWPSVMHVTLTISELLDDSVGAEWHRVQLNRVGNAWKVVEHRLAVRCERGPDGAKFVAGPCP